MAGRQRDVLSRSSRAGYAPAAHVRRDSAQGGRRGTLEEGRVRVAGGDAARLSVFSGLTLVQGLE